MKHLLVPVMAVAFALASGCGSNNSQPEVGGCGGHATEYAAQLLASSQNDCAYVATIVDSSGNLVTPSAGEYNPPCVSLKCLQAQGFDLGATVKVEGWVRTLGSCAPFIQDEIEGCAPTGPVVSR